VVLLNKHNYKEQEMYIVQDQLLPPSETLLLPSLSSLYKVYTRNQELPQPGDSRPSGVASTGGFGYVTIATYTVQTDDEEYGNLGGQH
jgi:hypothetical protein